MRKRVPREYEELFCVGELTEMEKRLYGGDPYRERVGGMHYCTKTEKAGDTLVLTVYPILGRSDRAKAEAARKAMSRERQTRYNRERARRRLALLHAIPNGGKRSKSEAARMKAAGVKPGVPDMFLPVAREGCHGLYIELKRRDGGRVSTEQTAWMEALARQGYKTALCHGWDAAREEIQRYLGGKWA